MLTFLGLLAISVIVGLFIIKVGDWLGPPSNRPPPPSYS